MESSRPVTIVEVVYPPHRGAIGLRGSLDGALAGGPANRGVIVQRRVP